MSQPGQIIITVVVV